MELLLEAVVFGILLGCFCAAVSIGLSISFGLLDVPHVAHPAFPVLASYCVYLLNHSYGIDPLVAGLMITPLFFLFGLLVSRIYYETFEKRGTDAGVRGIPLFFGVAFIIEVAIIMLFGVDQRSVSAPYIGKSWRILDMRIPIRQIVALAMALIGGTAHWIGPVLGAILLGVTQQVLTVTISSDLNVLLLGLMLVLFVVAAPQGIVGLLRRIIGVRL